MTDGKQELLPYNDILGMTSNNVVAYSNGDNNFISFEGFYVHGIFTGYKWQCVEFARRWLLLRKSCTFRNIGTAAEMWHELSYVEHVIDGQRFRLRTYPNGSPCKPRCDSFLLYSCNEKSPHGHIVVICDVQEDFIRIAEQNHLFYCWSNNSARNIPIVYRYGLYYIDDGANVMGWMEIENDDQLKPLDEYDVDCILTQYRQQKPLCKLQRCLFEITTMNNDCLSNSIDHKQEEVLMKSTSNSLCYYQTNEDFFINICTTANELYRLMIKITNEIIHSDELLKCLDIPKQFWVRIRQSLANERKFDFLDHINFKFDGENIKLCRYEVNHRLTNFLSAIEQEKSIRSIDKRDSFTSSFQLHYHLNSYWKCFENESIIHLLIDNDDNDCETINYMKKVITEAGIHIKVCQWPNEFYWKNSMIVDKDDEIVKIVWKFWNWEKIFRDFRYQNIAIKEENQWQSTMNEHPSLFDILLNKNIKIIEPLWKSIMHHPRFLSILCRKFPNYPDFHQYESILSEALKYTSSVKYSMDEEQNNIVQYHDAKENIDAQHFSQDLTRKTSSKDSDLTIISWIIHDFCVGFCINESIDPITDGKNTKIYSCII